MRGSDNVFFLIVFCRENPIRLGDKNYLSSAWVEGGGCFFVVKTGWNVYIQLPCWILEAGLWTSMVNRQLLEFYLKFCWKIVLMVQNSDQLRLVDYPVIYQVSYILGAAGGGFNHSLLLHLHPEDLGKFLRYVEQLLHHLSFPNGTFEYLPNAPRPRIVDIFRCRRFGQPIKPTDLQYCILAQIVYNAPTRTCAPYFAPKILNSI